jgi:Lar family restriction alleviation protein
MTTELKPCPFCGGEATVDYMAHWEWYLIKCDNDGCPVACVTDSDSKEEAIERWNSRTSGWRSCKDSQPEIGQTVLIAEKSDCKIRPYRILWAEYYEHGYKYGRNYIIPDWWIAIPKLPDLPEETEE